MEHNFSLEKSSHRIWNYKGDNYVHRMIRSSWLLESRNSTGAHMVAVNKYQTEDQVAYKQPLGQTVGEVTQINEEK